MSAITTWAPAPTYTWANLPAAGTAGRQAFASNAGTKGSFWYDDGTRWKPLNGSAVLATLDTASASIGNSETIVFQYLIPAGMWQVGDTIRVQSTLEKSGTTDTAVLTIRCGTAGTTSDTSITSGTWLSAANKTVEGFLDFRLDSATSSIQNSIVTGYGAASGVVSPITISSATANALYVSVGIRSGGTTDTVNSRAGMIQLFSKAN